jgi:FHS family glucose/mannose:H+ symporter-like MFS transporter
MSPELASVWVGRWSPTYLFLCLGLSMSLVLAFVIRPANGFSGEPPRVSEERAGNRDLQLIVIFAALGCLYVGVETSIGGWLMTYVHRLGDASASLAPIATSFFWVALLCGRMLAPAVLLRVSEARLLTATILIAFVSTALMLLSHSPVAITAAVAVTGLVLGPIYPLCLAKALAAMNDAPKAKWVFAFSGMGAAIFPWLTGTLSAREGSLRIGLLVPVLALVGMMLLNQLEISNSTAWKEMKAKA